MDATPKFDTQFNEYSTWYKIYVPDPRDYEHTVGYGIPDQSIFQENIKLKRTVDELHKRNHELIENQSKIEQKARIQQRQHDAKVYAYWKNKAETLEADQKLNAKNFEKQRLTAENLLREVTHLNELRRADGLEINHYREQVEKLEKELYFKTQEALAYKTWYEAEVDKPDNDSWKRKYDTLVNATDFCVDLIKSALKGKVYKQLTVNWEDESTKSDSEQCSTTDSLSC